MKHPMPPVESPWLTMVEAAEFLGYHGPQRGAIGKRFLKRVGCPLYPRTSTLMAMREDLQEIMRTQRCVRGQARRLEELREMAKDDQRLVPKIRRAEQELEKAMAS